MRGTTRQRVASALAAAAVVLLGAVPGVVPGAATASPAAAPGFPGDPACDIAVGVSGLSLLARLDPGVRPAQVAPGLVALGGHLVGQVPALGIVQVALPTRRMVDAVLPAVRALPGISWAERESVAHVQRSANDTYFKRQWALRVSRVSRAWDKELGTRNSVLVAVLDTGVSAKHPDLAGKVGVGYDFVNDDDDASDDEGHGTAVSGVIAGRSNNRKGIAGVSWGAKVLPVKVMDEHGSGTGCPITAGIVYAATHGAGVINMSLGGANDGGCALAYQAALEVADQEDVMVVASSGNEAAQGNPVDYPAACPHVVSVGATDDHDRITRFSVHNEYVDLTAPGQQVITTYYNAKKRTHGYAYESGTSLSAPMVAAAAALLRSQHPEWFVTDVEDRLEKTARDLGRKGRDDLFGYGRLDVARAVGL